MIMNLVKDKALENRVHLLGERSDIPRLLAALDIASYRIRTFAQDHLAGMGEGSTTLNHCCWISDGHAVFIAERCKSIRIIIQGHFEPQ